MKKFLKHIIILILTIIVAIMSIIAIGFRNNTFIGGILPKVDLLKKSYDSNKNSIILIGGSSVAFGIDSKIIESEFNYKYNVINLGLNARIGLKYNLDIIDEYVKEGDIVVLLPEYENYYNNSFYGKDVLAEVLEFYPQSINKISFRQVISMTSEINRYLYENKVKVIISGKIATPTNELFNDNGDFIHYEESKKKDITKSGKILSGEMIYNPNAISYINEASNHMKAKGVIVVYDFPPIPEDMYVEDMYDNIHEILQRDLDIDIIGEKERYIYPADYFYDTYYHLNYDSRKIRTKQLAEDLKNHL